MCDVCLEEIKKQDYTISLFKGEREEHDQRAPMSEYEVCPDCFEEFTTFLTKLKK